MLFYVIQLRERGPYVYKQSSQPVGVSFDVDGHTRTSQTWKKKAKFFKDESCKDCKEDDQVFADSEITIVHNSFNCIVK
jgi:hypothetical protein